MKIRYILLSILSGIFLISCNNNLIENYSAATSSVHFNFALPGQEKNNSRMITPEDSDVSKLLDSLTYILDLEYSSDGNVFTPVIAGQGFSNLTLVKLYLEDMDFQYGSWRMKLAGSSSTGIVLDGSTEFTVNNATNEASLDLRFSSEGSGSIKITILTDSTFEEASHQFHTYVYRGDTDNSENMLSTVAVTGPDFDTAWGWGSSEYMYKVGVITINSLAPGQYFIDIRVQENDWPDDPLSDDCPSYLHEAAYVYPGVVSSTVCHQDSVSDNAGNFIRLNYNADSSLDIFNTNVKCPEIIEIHRGYADFRYQNYEYVNYLIKPARSGYMFTGWYGDNASAMSDEAPLVAPYIQRYSPRDEDGYFVKKDYDFYAGWKALDSVLDGNKTFYVQLAQRDDYSGGNGYIKRTSLADLPNNLIPVNTSNSQIYPGFTNVSTLKDYIIVDGYIYFVGNGDDNNNYLKWTALNSGNNYSADLTDSGISSFDFNDSYIEAGLGYCPDTKIDQLFFANNYLYMAGHTNSGKVFLTKCYIDPETHVPDGANAQISYVSQASGVNYYTPRFAFAVNSTHMLVSYRDPDGHQNINSYPFDAAGAITENGAVIKELGTFYNITSTSLASSQISDTDAYISDIYVYKDEFYLLVNECNAGVSETSIKYDDTVVCTGGVLKMNSSLVEEENYFPEQSVKSYTISTTNDGTQTLKFKIAQSPADLEHFMGPNRILGTSDSGKKLIISDDGMYGWEDTSSTRKFKWEHRIVIFNLETAEIEYYIPVNFLYRGGQKADFNQIENYEYWTSTGN